MDQVFTAAPHHDVLVLLIQITILLVTARLLGEAAQRLGQPVVVGEILAGIVLGPSLLSGLFPFVEEWLIPQNEVQGYLLETVSLMGVMFLLLITGLEIDVALIRHQVRSAVGASSGGLMVTLTMGFALGQMIPEDLLVEPDERLIFSLFLATAMAISAIPVVAKILIDLDLTRRDIGQTIIASAMIDDTIGWILLSVVIGLASSGVVTVGAVLESVVSVLGFLFISFTAGRWLVSRLFDVVQGQLQMRDKFLSLIVFTMFLWGAISQALGIEALLGAFAVGVIFSQMPRVNIDVIHRLESITFGIFAPIFFAIAGLKVDIFHLLTPRLLLITVLVTTVAVICKMTGVYAGARLIGKRNHWTAIFFGSGLNARGSMGIIVANIGLSFGLLTQEMFSIIIVMALVTSLVAPALLRWALAHIVPEEQELERLKHEELSRGSFVATIQRVLLPVRRREKHSPTQIIEARLLERLNAQSNISLTLLSVAKNNNRAEDRDFLDKLINLYALESVNKKVIEGDNVGSIILDEAQKDYDLMVLGATEEQSDSEILFTPLVDFLMRSASCPTFLVQGRPIAENWQPRRVLVPSNGSLSARHAAEVAFAVVSADADEQVIILQVVEEAQSDHILDMEGTILARQQNIARQNVEQLCELGAAKGVFALPEVQIGSQPEMVILKVAKTYQVDLIILGTSMSVGSDRLYLGPRVERILKNTSCPVIVVNS